MTDQSSMTIVRRPLLHEMLNGGVERSARTRGSPSRANPASASASNRTTGIGPKISSMRDSSMSSWPMTASTCATRCLDGACTAVRRLRRSAPSTRVGSPPRARARRTPPRSCCAGRQRPDRASGCLESRARERTCWVDSGVREPPRGLDSWCSGSMPGMSFIARVTVCRDTPARAATSRIPTRRGGRSGC